MRILKFYADWCGPCRTLSKTIDSFKKTHPEVEIVPVNVDEDEELPAKYDVRNVPTLIKVIDNTEISRKTGLITINDLEKFVYS